MNPFGGLKARKFRAIPQIESDDDDIADVSDVMFLTCAQFYTASHNMQVCLEVKAAQERPDGKDAELAELRKKHQDAVAELSRVRTSHAELKTRHAKVQAENGEIKKKHQDAVAEADALRAEMTRMRARYTELKKEHAVVLEENRQLHDEKTTLRLDALKRDHI